MAAIMMEGPLSKWTNVMKGWQYRWFVLDENSGLLSYYTSKEKMMRGARRGCVRLKGAVIGIDDEDDSTFTITVDQKTFHFQARDADEKERWIDALENTILRHSQPVKKWEKLPSPSMNEFDKKLSETDAYLQILIEQVKDLENRIAKCDDDESRGKYNMIKETAEGMIESIKQSIVLLQITKQNLTPNSNFSEPIQGPVISLETASQQSETGASSSASDPLSRSAECIQSPTLVSDPSRLLEDSGASPLSLSLPNLNRISKKPDSAVVDGSTAAPPQPGSGASSQKKVPHSARTSAARASPSDVSCDHQVSSSASGVVPDSSYSSSEDEDFFDAEESTGDQVNGADGPEHDRPTPPKVIASQDDYFDELYDYNEEEDLGPLEGHGNMIMHLLSQVRIGMDLTKVVLPTFILEKRSLLEMFADFFAHPDIFVGIVDQKTPRDRMVQTVRWYLSAFHAGRRTHVAKKPYNPILGETFHCYYDVPNINADPEKCQDGPVPWATKSNLTFIAEQVSHHPPISAFYAECYNKRISMDGYIWTKSKFLGLSIGVHNIGQSLISVPEHDEDYIITFPNAYGRSILTLPWMELGGKINITCPKSGYYANIEFHTKMNEIFVDTKNMPVIKKRVIPIDQQEEYESRRLWKEVTYNLKEKNIEAATGYKHKLEQRQREEARERKERGVKWETKQFHEVGEHWVYDKTLVRRLEQQAS